MYANSRPCEAGTGERPARLTSRAMSLLFRASLSSCLFLTGLLCLPSALPPPSPCCLRLSIYLAAWVCHLTARIRICPKIRLWLHDNAGKSHGRRAGGGFPGLG
ncbi:hypothetical protein E2C01_091609 [Portunus trituberculatus]|uniref:Uncharacterized protein n=1 Tax=Portunus trituberculatus TaxID=210409 RepID=A0A5B7JHY5_PORTR|nr:hypothetical protein [Portunus trituberculatus]